MNETYPKGLTVTGYDVFPGIRLLYIEAKGCLEAIQRPELGDVLEIEHCRQGRAESQLPDAFYYLSDGDLAIARRSAVSETIRFPEGRYQGVTIRIDLEKAPGCLSCILEDVCVQPKQLCQKYCGDGKAFIARSNASMEHIFSELYSVPEAIRLGYCKVKVLELLLFLSGMDYTADALPQRRLSPGQAALAKEVCAYLNAHMESRITLAMLSEQFHCSGTLIKNSFKSVYGESLYAYTRAQKMRSAAELLRTTDDTILEIAGRFGYDNASKFAGAFRDVIGITPNEYRQNLPA